MPEIVVKKRRRKERNASFVGDVTYPDNTRVHAGQVFIKTWLITNTGDLPWQDCYLQCIDDLPRYAGLPVGLKPALEKISVIETSAGETVEISATFIAPTLPGCVISYWKLVDEQGNDLMTDSYLLHCLVQVVSF